MKVNLMMPLFFILVTVILFPVYGDLCWGISLKDARHILIREDGKGRLEIVCPNFVKSKIECEFTKTEISFPNDNFTTAKEEIIQKLKLLYQERKQLIQEIPNSVFDEKFRQDEYFKFLKDDCNSFIKMQKDNDLIFSSNLEEICNLLNFTKEGALKLISAFLNSKIPTNELACGIFVEKKVILFNRITEEKLHGTFERSKGPCLSTKYYELIVGQNGTPKRLTETLLSIDSNFENAKCNLKKGELLKPSHWSVGASNIVNLPCTEVDWRKLSVEQ